MRTLRTRGQGSVHPHGRGRVKIRAGILTLALAVLFVGLALAAPPAHTAMRSSSVGLTLITEPDAGIAPIYALLRSAHKSVDLVIYELEDTQATAILAADAQRGVRVRVLLDSHFVGHYNKPAYSYLRSHGVDVRWASSRFDLTHEKAIVIDGKLAAIMTMNLTSRYYSSTRDFVLVDRGSGDVKAVEATFATDWAGGGSARTSPADLVWSPGAQGALVALIASAQHTLLVENEEMGDQAVISALEAAARRGVAVEIVMTRQSTWTGAFNALERAGVKVRTYASSASLYIHAKAIAVDPGLSDQRVFVGSQNFSLASLLYNRELGLITPQPAIVADIAAVISRDGAGATPWSPSPTPTPTPAPTPSPSPTGEVLTTVSASVSNPTPQKDSSVTASCKALDQHGAPISGAQATFTWHYKTTTPVESAMTDSTGVASCTRDIGNATSGYFVSITISVSYSGVVLTTSTGFTPR